MPKHYSWQTRLAIYADLARGRSVTSISRTHPVSKTIILDWAKLAGMKLALGAQGGTVRVDIDRLPAPAPDRSYRRLTLADRAFIQAARALQPPVPFRQIAKELAVAPSTVSREVNSAMIRCGRQGTRYSAEVAHFHALTQRPRSRPGKLHDPRLRAEVVSRLNEKHSPRQVAHRLRADFPTQQEMHVSHETIYQALYVQGKGALRHELTVVKALRSGRTSRVPQSKLPPRKTRPWLEGARLRDRPPAVSDRSVPGHWEGDLVVGPGNSGIVTLVERQSRYALVGRLPGNRESATVIEVLQRMIEDLPKALTQTLTWDQGVEMARHAEFTVATGCQVFFCDPHAPWQRGSNENLNGLIRDFYPKGTNFNTVADADLAQMQRMLNDRPRQTLQWRTPREKLNEILNGVALTT